MAMTGFRRAIPALGISLLAALLVLPMIEARELDPVATFKVDGAGASVAWSPDGRRLAASSRNNITILDPFNGNILATMSPTPGPVSSLVWSANGSLIAFCSGGIPYLEIWDVNTSKEPAHGYGAAAQHFDWSPVSGWLAHDWGDLVSYNISIVNPLTGTYLKSIPTNLSWVYALDWSPDGLRLAGLLGGRSLRIWNVLNDTYLDCNTTGMNYDITCIAWSPDGGTIVAGVNDTEGWFNIRYFSTETGELTGGSAFNNSRTNCVAWSPDGRSIAAGLEDGTIHVLTDREYSNMTDQTLVGHTKPVRSLDWSLNGTYLASATEDGTVRIWGPAGSLPMTKKLHMTYEAWPSTVASGGSVNLTVRLLNWTSEPVEGALITFSSSAGGAFSAVNYSGDGRYTVTFSAPNVSTNTTLTVSVAAAKQGFDPYSGSATLAVFPPPAGRRVPGNGVHVDDNTRTVVVFTGGAIVVLAAALSMSETGRYGGMLLFIPLFTRMKRDTVLDNFTRGQLQGYIVANPGIHMNAIRDRFELSNGEVSYHLRVLEREGFISSQSDGLRRRFYPGERIDRKEPVHELTVAQNLLISFMEKFPGITGTELSRLAGTSPQVVNYHLKRLWRMDVIKMDREGRIVRCFVRPEKLQLFRRTAARAEETVLAASYP